MFDRRAFKEQAKDTLRTGIYWKSFLAGLLMAFATGYSFDFGSVFSHRNSFHDFGDISSVIVPFLAIFIGIALFALIIGILVLIFVRFSFEVGASKYFVRSCENDVQLSYVAFGFKGGNYLEVIKGLLYRNVLNFLWYLLLIVPGIVKYYSYGVVRYILADNPQIGYDRALKLSMEMTHGYKWDMFVLDLSFIGWFLLGAIPCGLGIIFVQPYYQTAKAQMYQFLRQKAVMNGLSSFEELKVATTM